MATYYLASGTINELLKKKKITYKTFGEAFGKNEKSVINLFQNGSHAFDEDELDDISAYLGVSKNVLMINPTNHSYQRINNLKFKYLLVRPKSDIHEHLKKETVKAVEKMENAGYSYKVSKNGQVTAEVKTNCDELKAQLAKYAEYCDEKDKEIAELKSKISNLEASYNNEKAHAEFFEKNYREVTAKNNLLEAEIKQKNDLVKSYDYGMAKDLRDAVAERDKYKDILLKMLLEKHQEEVG